MKDFSLGLLGEPLFLTGAIASGFVLFCLEISDVFGAKAETKYDSIYLDGRRVSQRRTGLRVRFGSRAVLENCPLSPPRYWDPRFALSHVLPHEPASLVFPAAAWLAVLCGEPLWGAGIGAVAVVWRVVYDYCCLGWMTPRMRVDTLLLKVIWQTAFGIFMASLAWTFLCALMVVIVVFAFLCSQATNPRRR